MMREVERCSEALAIAASGKLVALVSSGDAGIYGMAGLALELADVAVNGAPSPYQGVEIVVVPGVSAVQAAASVLGAPLMHDFAVISLSDLMTPLETIRKRLRAAADADFVVALYNPRSKGRVTQIEEAAAILIAARGPQVPVGIVRNACRSGEERIITTLGEMLSHPIDMFSIVIIGNAATRLCSDGRIVTPRGYATDGSRERSNRPACEGSEPTTETKDPRALMFCGTGSDVGKSVIAAGFCRILKRRGIAVAPFKSQNMALNSAVTPEGGEIGRAQAVQAEACGIPCHTDMNPVLLKPNSDTGSQVIVQGRVVRNMVVKEYNAYKPEAFVKVRESFERLKSRFSFIVMEGAGSIAEINLRAHDIANLKVAAMAGAPAILIADIDRGGVFAQIVGTLELLTAEEKAQVKGVIINKFRGDPTLLTSGIEFVQQRTGIPVLGVLPWFSGLAIPEEDSVALQKRGNPSTGGSADAAKLRIGVIKLSRISNYTDFSALEAEPDVALFYLDTPSQIASMDLLVLPGSKSTTADLRFLQEQGLFDAIGKFPGPIVGICGGYQMLGTRVLDPHRVEGDLSEAAGLGLLDVETTMLKEKETHQVEAQLTAAALGLAPSCLAAISGYEIHMGQTDLGPGALPFATIAQRSGSTSEVADGAVSKDGRVFGTYLHGIFDNAQFRTAFLNRLRREKGIAEQLQVVPLADPFDLLALHMEKHLDLERIFEICGATVTQAV
jgi:adenosylcobyric acid synthase